MSAELRFVRLAARVVAACVLFVVIASSAGHARANPLVQQGGSDTFAKTGSDAPAYVPPFGLGWDIMRNGSTVASRSQPNGWAVSVSYSNFTVSAPIDAVISTNYEVRAKQNQPTAIAPMSAYFDLILGQGVKTVTISPAAVIGGGSSTGTVTLFSAAGPNSYVNLASSNPSAASVPSQIIVLPGQTTRTFTATTYAVPSTTDVTITATATFGGFPRTTTLTVAPGLQSVTVDPTTVIGGNPVTGTVTLGLPAPTGGATVTLTTDNSALAEPWASVDVPEGQTTAQFAIATYPVAANATATITGTYSGYSRQASLTVMRGASHLTAVSTGTGRITLYWGGSPAASGYNVYRGTTPGGENYAQPANGGTAVTDLSYAGGYTFTFTDVGLTNEAQYFYTVKALYAGVETAASNEDSDVVDPDAIPWDSRDPAVILPALAAVSPEPVETAFRAMGPDGAIYESGAAAQQPPDGVLNPDGVSWTERDNTVTAASAERAAPANQIPPSRTGPIRRLRSNLTFLRCTATVDLPRIGAGLCELSPYTYPGVTRTVMQYDVFGNLIRDANGQPVTATVPWSTADTPYIYLGSSVSGGALEVDAGLMLQRDQNGGLWVWKPFIVKNAGLVGKLFPSPFSSQQPAFEPGDQVYVGYYTQLPTVVQASHAEKGKTTVFLHVSSATGGGAVTYSAFVPDHPVGGTSVRMKRCNTIAQSFPNGSTDWRAGCRLTGSYVLGAGWRNVRISGDPNSAGVYWSTGLNWENLMWPWYVVSAQTISPYYLELNVNVDMR